MDCVCVRMKKFSVYSIMHLSCIGGKRLILYDCHVMLWRGGKPNKQGFSVLAGEGIFKDGLGFLGRKGDISCGRAEEVGGRRV